MRKRCSIRRSRTITQSIAQVRTLKAQIRQNCNHEQICNSQQWINKLLQQMEHKQHTPRCECVGAVQRMLPTAKQFHSARAQVLRRDLAPQRHSHRRIQQHGHSKGSQKADSASQRQPATTGLCTQVRGRHQRPHCLRRTVATPVAAAPTSKAPAPQNIAAFLFATSTSRCQSRRSSSRGWAGASGSRMDWRLRLWPSIASRPCSHADAALRWAVPTSTTTGP